MNGYPPWMVIFGYPLRPFLRVFVLPKLLTGQSPKGIPTARIFVPSQELDDSNECEQFKSCILTFQASTSAMHPHPGFGKLTKAEFSHFHAAHAAHHLSFLHPRKVAG